MKLDAGNKPFNELLEGGYEDDTITIIYGPAGSGKTNACLHASISCANKGKKIVYIDTEGGFSIERLQQLEDYSEEVKEKIFILRPTTFAAQKGAFEKLRDLMDERIGLIVVDTIAMLYRLEMGKNSNVYGINKELGTQIGLLSEIARKNRIPVIITNQVYSAMDESENVKMVGGELLKYQSKCIIEIKKARGSKRGGFLRKHRSIKDKEILYSIKEKGFE